MDPRKNEQKTSCLSWHGLRNSVIYLLHIQRNVEIKRYIGVTAPRTSHCVTLLRRLRIKVWRVEKFEAPYASSGSKCCADWLREGIFLNITKQASTINWLSDCWRIKSDIWKRVPTSSVELNQICVRNFAFFAALLEIGSDSSCKLFV